MKYVTSLSIFAHIIAEAEKKLEAARDLGYDPVSVMDIISSINTRNYYMGRGVVDERMEAAIDSVRGFLTRMLRALDRAGLIRVVKVDGAYEIQIIVDGYAVTPYLGSVKVTEIGEARAEISRNQLRS